MTSPVFKVTMVGENHEWQSAVKSAAYSARERLWDNKDKEFRDFTTNKADLLHQEIRAPKDVPEYLTMRESLWNKVHDMENRKDANYARSIIVGLPYELTHKQRLELVQQYVDETLVSRGMVVDIGMHKPDPKKGTDHRNYHAHLIVTLRKAGQRGLYRTKTREWDTQGFLYGIRASWADCQTRHLQRAGFAIVIDPRTLMPIVREKDLPPNNLNPYKEPLHYVKPPREQKSATWHDHDEKLVRNITRAGAMSRRLETKRVRLHQLRTKLYRRAAFLKGLPGSEHIQEKSDYPDKRSLAHIEGRLWLLMSIEDRMFAWDTFIYGFEKAVRLQRQRFLKKWSKDRAKEQREFTEEVRERSRTRT